MRRLEDRIASVVLGLVCVLALVAGAGGVAAGHTGDDGMHHHDGWMGSHGGMWGGAGWIWLLGGLLVVVAVPAIAAVALLARRDDGHDDALAELRRRYAAGDLDDEEFERRRARLEE